MYDAIAVAIRSMMQDYRLRGDNAAQGELESLNKGLVYSNDEGLGVRPKRLGVLDVER